MSIEASVDKMKILIVQRELTHYRIPVFLQLACTNNVQVLFSRYESKGAADKARDLPYGLTQKVWGFFPARRYPYVCYISTIGRILSERPEVIIHEFSLSILNTYLMPLVARLIGSRLIWWSHGYNRVDKQRERALITRLRVWLHRTASACIVYSEGGKAFLIERGMPDEKVFVAWNAIDTHSLDLARKKLELSAGADNLSSAAPGELDFVFLGRMVPDKRPLVAAEAFRKCVLEHHLEHVRLHFIGTGTEEKRVRDLCKELEGSGRIFFHDEVTDEQQLAAILSTCSIMMNPGYLGLNVVHALAFNLPIIAPVDGAAGIHHSPEYEYLKGSKAFIPVQDPSAEGFAEACLQLAGDPERLRGAREAATSSYRQISLDRMLEGIKAAIQFVCR
ncbi:glycosyltransferase family 4 protein [Candidatus Neomarinimicrobiota bacterium]